MTLESTTTNDGRERRSPARLAIDAEGRVISIQHLVIDAPAFRPRPGDAARWLHSYWQLVSVVTFGLIQMRTYDNNCVLELRGLKLPVLSFGAPWVLEGDRFVGWALALRDGLLNGGTGGSFVCAAEQRADGRWYCTVMLRGFVPRIARLRPVAFWSPLYCWTQGILHHCIGISYLVGRKGAMQNDPWRRAR